jgi:hypothetical protein
MRNTQVLVPHQVFRKMQNEPATCSHATKPPLGATSAAGAICSADWCCSSSEDVEIVRDVLSRKVNQSQELGMSSDSYASACSFFSLRLCTTLVIDFSAIFTFETECAL